MIGTGTGTGLLPDDKIDIYCVKRDSRRAADIANVTTHSSELKSGQGQEFEEGGRSCSQEGRV